MLCKSPVARRPFARRRTLKDWQGQGYAAALLLFALRLAPGAAYDVASWGVITHPLDDGVRAFYAR